MQVLVVGEVEVLCRPCVDCGVMTGCYCDFCLAACRMPPEVWCDGQMTPLCTRCDRAHGECHFCRGLSWCTPPTRPYHVEALGAEEGLVQKMHRRKMVREKGRLDFLHIVFLMY